MAGAPNLRTRADVARFLERQSPRGAAWRVTDENSRWYKFLYACAGALGLWYNRAVTWLRSETVPGYEWGAITAPVETLAAWEAEYGLTAGTLTTAQRKAQLLAHLLAVGGNSAAYFVAIILAGYGVAITITTYTPIKPCSPPCYPLYSTHAKFRWTVTIPGGTPAAVVTSIQALIRKYSPAHTVVDFA